ncbi:serine hydrolase domain-containing protein [Phenylobacterium sp.]|uniref:serine hydrolase domain-containing protein n=1 Tax=Phenylobacterium sp. TaxID=1871053 RepID=UPI001221EC19|nr:serine hydrolase domain-containing protein [Phenylobacterium sp.]THD50671.1 MAG: class A beta-lactamase-related serine hydrolase [Phenylobacterium sp.]
MLAYLGLAVVAAFAVSSSAAVQSFTPAQIASIDQGVVAYLGQRGVPSASIAVVRGGEIVFAKAYGSRSVSPSRPATVQARYNIASVSKQMTATALLMLIDQGKLSLDDPISRWLPELMDANRITVRQVLSHTAGYKGFFLAETPPIEATRSISPHVVVDRWGRMPLDYPPGSSWQYSNTDYTIVGLIVERVSGQALADVLRQNIFEPLGMTSATVLHGEAPPAKDAQGYTRHALGPLRLSPIIGDGWGFGDGGVSMSATDLAKWDIGVLRQRLLSAKAYAEQQTPVTLSDGKTAPYGLGVFVDQTAGRRRVKHPGSEEGFLTENRIYPDDGAAVVVTVNADFGDAQDDIADQLEHLIFDLPPPPERNPRRSRPTVDAAIRPQDVALAHKLVSQLASGTLDRRLLSADANHYFTPATLADYRDSLGPLGEPIAFERLQSAHIGEHDVSVYRLMWANEWVAAILRCAPDGRVVSFKIYAPL